MRIIYLHQYFNTPEMSGGTRSYEMARRLVQMGHEVHMITSWRSSDGRSTWFETEEQGVKIHWLPVEYSNYMSYGRRVLAFLKFAVSAARRAAAISGDIVFATSTPLTIVFPAVYCKFRLRIPMVFEVRDLWPELPIAMGALKNPAIQYLSKRLERWAYRNSESVVALSPGMKDGVSATGYGRRRIAVIPNSSDNTEFSVGEAAGDGFRAERPWLGSSPLIVYPGTLGRINGVDWLVDLAVALRAKNSDAKILVIGDGAEREKIIARASEFGVLNKNFYIERQVPKSVIPAVLSASDFVCSLFIDLPEMRANSANKFFDALAAGRPVLINYGGWQKDLVEESACGLCVWRLSPEASADAVISRLADRDWIHNAQVSAKSLAINRFDRDALATQLEAVLSSAFRLDGERAEVIAP